MKSLPENSNENLVPSFLKNCPTKMKPSSSPAQGEKRGKTIERRREEGKRNVKARVQMMMMTMIVFAVTVLQILIRKST